MTWQILPCRLTRIFSGLMSLWITPSLCILHNVFTISWDSKSLKFSISIGVPHQQEKICAQDFRSGTVRLRTPHKTPIKSFRHITSYRSSPLHLSPRSSFSNFCVLVRLVVLQVGSARLSTSRSTTSNALHQVASGARFQASHPPRSDLCLCLTLALRTRRS